MWIAQKECFPRLDLVAAKSASEHLDAPVCVFDLSQQMVGQLFLADVQDDSIRINYLFAARHFQCVETEAVLRTITVTNPLDSLRRFLICPTCNEARRDLYYVQWWACARCHRLLYRSQLVDKDVRLWEERDRLGALLKRGRPKGMHNATYFKLRLRLAELEGRLHGRDRKVASDAHNAIVAERWVPAAEIDLWSARYRVLVGQFVRRNH